MIVSGVQDCFLLGRYFCGLIILILIAENEDLLILRCMLRTGIIDMLTYFIYIIFNCYKKCSIYKFLLFINQMA